MKRKEPDVKSHKLVAEYFEQRGFNVIGKSKHMFHSGHDLYAVKNDRLISIEVKRIRTSARTDKVEILKAQFQADLLAIVTKQDTVLIMPMSLVRHRNNNSKTACLSLGTLVGLL
jgi:Holliday junction resolvase